MPGHQGSLQCGQSQAGHDMAKQTARVEYGRRDSLMPVVAIMLVVNGKRWAIRVGL